MMRPTLVLFALLLAACGRNEQKTEAKSDPAAAPAPTGTITIPADSPKLQQIKVERVSMAEVPTDEVTSPGKVELNPNRVSRVVLPVPGRISTVLVHIGDSVHQGETLLTLESPDADAAESAYRQAQAAMTQARANLVKAQADYDRSSDLFQHQAVARKEVLNAENALAQAKAGTEQSNAAVEQAARKLSLLGLKAGAFGQKIAVAAPLSGKVLDMSVAAGEYRNDTNAPLMTIADMSTVWVSSDVPETSIRLIKPGERVDITLSAYPGEVFRGRVTRIADTVDPQTRTVKVRAELDNRLGRLRPEMFGSIRHTEATHSMPVVPVGAVIEGEGHSYVFREEERGSFRQVEVRIGQRSGDVLPILSGVKPGDRVVVDGAMLLRSQS